MNYNIEWRVRDDGFIKGTRLCYIFYDDEGEFLFRDGGVIGED